MSPEELFFDLQPIRAGLSAVTAAVLAVNRFLHMTENRIMVNRFFLLPSNQIYPNDN
jgi:hypothetical protein